MVKRRYKYLIQILVKKQRLVNRGISFSASPEFSRCFFLFLVEHNAAYSQDNGRNHAEQDQEENL